VSDDFLRRYAELIVRVGANVAEGQEVIVSGELEHAPLMRAVTEAAWAAGARNVQVVPYDDYDAALRARHGAEEMLDESPWSLVGLYRELLDADAAEIRIRGDSAPEAWDGVDESRAARVQRPREASDLRTRLINEGRVAWTIAGYPTVAWATRMFGEPDVDRLRDAIATAVRLDRPDPVAAWQEHLDRLQARAALLTERRFDAIRFRGPGTDLTVGLLPDAAWTTALYETRSGRRHAVNLPTEEVFTTPDPRRTSGRLTSTRPISAYGIVLDRVELEFTDGRAEVVGASAGESFVREQLRADEGAPRLGEVALVDGASPLARSGHLFYDPLYDENIASHVAYGGGYTRPVPGTDVLPPREQQARGVNQSDVHTDLPIGGAGVEVDGLDEKGAATRIIDGDDWVLTG
jgi:aminopeptidase